MQIELTKEEHFALTAVLRCSLSHDTLERVGLLDLYLRLQAPYMAELERRSGYSSGYTFMLPAFERNGSMKASLHDVKETSMSVDWYQWNRQEAGSQP
jgi:hypothetical protein